MPLLGSDNSECRFCSRWSVLESSVYMVMRLRAWRSGVRVSVAERVFLQNDVIGSGAHPASCAVFLWRLSGLEVQPPACIGPCTTACLCGVGRSDWYLRSVFVSLNNYKTYRLHLQIPVARRVTSCTFLTENPQFWSDLLNPHCCVAVSARCKWIDTHLCVEGRELQ
jgi:hypothetical protein